MKTCEGPQVTTLDGDWDPVRAASEKLAEGRNRMDPQARPILSNGSNKRAIPLRTTPFHRKTSPANGPLIR